MSVVYRLTSSPLIHTPGIVAWAINGYAFKADRAAIERTLTDGYKLPVDAARALLSKEAPYSVDGDSVVFTWPPVAEIAPAARPARKRARLTQDDVKGALRNLGLTFRSRDGEFRVNYRGGTEGTAYYTDDLSDALDTGREMAAYLARKAQQLVTLRVPLSIARANALESFQV